MIGSVLAFALLVPSADLLGAETVPNLGRFLEQYLGVCGDNEDPLFDYKTCEREAAEARSRRSGKVLKVEVQTESDQVQFAGFDQKKQAYRIHLTPFFTERGLGLSAGKPEARASDGLPSVRNVPVWVKVANGQDDFSVRRELERGMLRLEVFFKPGQPWALRKRGEAGSYRGASMSLVRIRVHGSRGLLAEQSY
ncbi:MAG: hypothetical protein HYV07_01080 [Deltaproteobacteria bacterium]|nr:hypothetical protein [Deltaproteobacteria bacterium]